MEHASRPVMPNTRVPLVFDEGRNRLVGRVWEPPMPGSPPGPPPEPGPPRADDGPSRPGTPFPQPPPPPPPPKPYPVPPPVRPALSWLPALALPSLLLLAAIDHAVWLAWL